MSELEKLIKELCPNGVEYKPLGEVCEIGKGIQFNKENMQDEGSYPVINGGVNPSGYIEQFNNNENTITISQGGASAGYVNWIKTKFWAGAHCYVVKPLECVLNRYLFHFVKSQEHRLQECQYGAGIPALSKSTVSDLLIPVPPLPVQHEIVRILDNFTELTKELTKELTARKKQYEHYRDMLLSFDDIRAADQADNVGGGYNNNVIYRKLGQLCLDITSGKNNSRSNGGQYIVYGSTGAIGKCDKYIYSGERLLVARVGANAGYVYAVDGEYDVSDNTLMVAKVSGCDFKFLFHCLRNANLNQYAKGGGQPLITATQLKNIEIPVPPLETQKRIVSILDKFEMLANSLSDGLPAEIEARKKQYEYYRDKLLDFKDVGGGIVY